MSRSGYSDDSDNLGLYRGAVRAASRGKRGQQFFRDLVAALDALPEKVLIAGELCDAEGDFCALGALGASRLMPLEHIDPHDAETVAGLFNIAECLAREVVYENDEANDGHRCIAGRWTYEPETPQQRWARMRAWAVANILPENPAP